MKNTITVKLLVLFIVAFSLATLPGALSNGFQLPGLPTLPRVHAVTQSPNLWYPNGPAETYEQDQIYNGQTPEFTACFGSTPACDLTDWTLTPSLETGSTAICPGTAFTCTTSINEHGYDELQFLLTQPFWGIGMSFGNSVYSTCAATPTTNTAGCPGLNIRQGLAHLIDRSNIGNGFAATTCTATNICTPIDDPFPISLAPPGSNSLPTPPTCTWDIFGTAANPACATTGNIPAGIVGCQPVAVTTGNCAAGDYNGGSAYRISGSTNTGVPFPWLQSNPSPDFCVAANHIADAFNAQFGAGSAHLTGAGTTVTNCTNGTLVLSSAANAQATGHTVGIFARSDDPPRLALGQGIFDSICAIFTGVFGANGSLCTSGASCPATGPYVCLQTGPITAFQGFLTPVSPGIVNQNWFVYTGAFIGVFPFDSTLFFLYASQFVSGTGGTEQVSGGGPCSNLATPSFSAANYMYACNSAFDVPSTASEIASCVASPSTTNTDPQPGQTAPTFATCAGATFTGSCISTSGCTAVSAMYQALQVYGQNELTIPVFTTVDQFGYGGIHNNWVNVVNNIGEGLPANPCFVNSWLDAYSQSSAVTGEIQQGFKETTRSLSPYIATTAWDFYVLGKIYDCLMVENSANNGQLINWMVTSNQLIPASSLTYTAPAGTVAAYRFTLNGAQFFQNGAKVTPFDVAFSDLSLKATAAFQSTGLAPMTGFTILSPTQFDIDLNFANQLSTLTLLTTITVQPGALWTGSSAYNADVAKCTPGSSTFTPSCYSTPSVYSLAGGAPSGFSGTACSGPCLVTATSNVAAGSYGDMDIGATQSGSGYDPLASGTLVGSGSFECASLSGVVGGNCAYNSFTTPTSSGTATGTMNPPISGEYVLTAYNKYFRSDPNAAAWFWSQMTGAFSADFGTLSGVASCLGTSGGTPARCVHWQQGIGGSNPVSFGTLSSAGSYVGLGWVSPFDYYGVIAPQPAGIGTGSGEGTVPLTPSGSAAATGFAPILWYETGFSVGNAPPSTGTGTAGTTTTLEPSSTIPTGSSTAIGCAGNVPGSPIGYDC